MKTLEIVNKICETYFVNCEISVIPDRNGNRFIRADFTTSCKGMEKILTDNCESCNDYSAYWFADGMVKIP